MLQKWLDNPVLVCINFVFIVSLISKYNLIVSRVTRLLRQHR
jgi:hypothetical protein